MAYLYDNVIVETIDVIRISRCGDLNGNDPIDSCVWMFGA